MKRIHSVLIGIFSILVLTAFVGYSNKNASGEKKDDSKKEEIFVSYEDVKIYPWEKEGDLYFFLPSDFTWEQSELVASDGSFWIDGKSVDFSTKKGEHQSYDIETQYSYQYAGEDFEKEGTIIFMQSANIGTVYIETETGSMEQINQDKEYQESGLILVKDSLGDVCYMGLLDSIKGRGNASWNTDKKSYSIKLSKAADLFQMGEAKNWTLLSNIFDGSKLQNKVCLDMAGNLGLSYTSQSEWVELYLNGQYQGNYLLCEKIEVNENRVDIADLEEQTERLNGDLRKLETFDTGIRKGVIATHNPENITGGYLIEKDYYYDSISGFITESDNPFSIKAPQYATQEQVDYIAEDIQKIENMILSEDDELFEYLDLDSFVLRYLLDETVLNFDLGITSMYFYKEQDDQKLYSGPIWDYDGCMGSGGFTDTNVLAALEIQNYHLQQSLTWYPYLYKNKIFYDRTVEVYKETIRPYIMKLIEDEGMLDNYAGIIENSMKMDMLRWPSSDYWSSYYEHFENNVRYIKYFLARRLRFLDREWLGEDNHYETEGNGEQHTVTFIGKTETESFEVSDGEVVLATPEYLLEENEWWYNMKNPWPFYPGLPVYEDLFYQAQ